MTRLGKAARFVYLTNGRISRLSPDPIIAKRNPTAADFDEIGTVWINTLTESAWTLTSTVGGAQWKTSPASGVGTFTTVDIDPGDLTIVSGDAFITAGDLEVTAGNVTIGGDLTVAGDTSISGDFDLTAATAIDLTTTFDGAQALYFHANGGTSETIEVHSDQGTGVASVKLLSDVGGITLRSTGLASADAINLEAPAGGIDMDGALQVNIASSQDAAGAITLSASAGGITLAATGEATQDILVTNTGGSIGISATENVSDAIVINATGAAAGLQLRAGTAGILVGTDADTVVLSVGDIAPTASRTTTIGGGTVITAAVTDLVDIAPDGATTNANSIKQVDIATGGVTLGQNLVNIATGNRTSGTHTVAVSTGTGTKTVNVGNADGLTTVNIDAITLINDSINVNTSINTGTSTGAVAIGNAAAGAMTIDTAAGISIDAATASNVTCSGADLTIASTTKSVVINGGEAAVDAVTITATDVAGGLDLNAGTGGITIDTTAAFSIDGATASNVTCSGADLTIESTTKSVVVTGGEAAIDAVQITASDVAGGLDLNAGTGGITIDTTGTLSLDSAGATNLTATGAFDVSVISTLGSVVLNGGEAAVDAITITATDAAGGVDINAGTGGITLDTTGTLSIDATAAMNMTATGAFDVTVSSTAGKVINTSAKAAADAIEITASDAAGGLDLNAGTAGITLDSTGSISIDAAGASNLSTTTGDMTVHSTAGSIIVSSGEAVADAIKINATDAAGGIQLVAGTGSIALSSLGSVSMVPDTTTEASPTAATTLDKRVGVCTFTGFTTAAAAAEVFTITNSFVSATSAIFVTVSNIGSNDAQMTLTRVKQAAGSFQVTATNNGAAALNGNVVITYWVIA
jgi:hypothetical protein